jgi:uncharacterized protein YodC (DUF2158 family)
LRNNEDLCEKKDNCTDCNNTRLRDALSDGTFHCNWFETGYCSSDSWSWYGDEVIEECPESFEEPEFVPEPREIEVDPLPEIEPTSTPVPVPEPIPDDCILAEFGCEPCTNTTTVLNGETLNCKWFPTTSTLGYCSSEQEIYEGYLPWEGDSCEFVFPVNADFDPDRFF